MKQKYSFMSILRVLSMVSIVFYHMLITLYIYGIRQLDSISIFFENANMHIAKVGVCLFFMLSGAGLMLSSKDQSFNLKDFYFKRFKKILIPFYVVYVCYFTFLVITHHILLSNPFEGKELKPYSFIFSLLGMDAYLENFRIPTCSLGIGEWFLGCLMLIYIVYPILRACMLKNKYITILIATIYYVLMNVFYSNIQIFKNVPMYTNAAIKIYDFILGMFLVLVLESIPKFIYYIAFIFNLFFIVYPDTLPGVDSFQIPIHGLLAFLIFAYFEKIFNKHPKVIRGFDILATYSYEYFLIHHFVILHLSKIGQNTEFGNSKLLILFGGEILLTTILTIILKKIVALIYQLMERISRKDKAN